ncbi:hypothetical protein [Bacillus mycoides]|uniref:hypothetical protein n=1 Tax=Bacillus mycoides TaxID=1405 RepID=UPI00027999A1|nr:hypothetical protein [Bacillus mycoides]EJR94494.1 hypothetical protein IKM_05544 [Bacillus mycoides]
MILTLCSSILLTGMVACSNNSDESSVKTVDQNKSAEKMESTSKEAFVEETKLSIEDTLSKEDQEIVDGLFNSVPKLKTLLQLEAKYSTYAKLLTVKVTKPNSNSTNKNEKEYYKVRFEEGTMLEHWTFDVNPESKEVLFKESSNGSKDYTLEEFNDYVKEIDENKIKEDQKMRELKYPDLKTQ